MRFKAVTQAAPPPASPLLLFDELPRMTGAVPELWRQQGDILREYGRAFVDVPDVAIELPTGTGKTIVGLLIADWRRRRGEQVVYACPTRLLAYQVSPVARREGIPSVTLVRGWRSWPPLDRSQYESGDAVAIATYNTVFNSSPKIGSPGTLLFDDAHSGEQYVAESWSVEVDRFEHPATWTVLIEALRPALDGMFLQRILDDIGDANLRSDVRLVVPSRRQGMVEKIDTALASLPANSDQSFRRSTVPGGLLGSEADPGASRDRH